MKKTIILFFCLLMSVSALNAANKKDYIWKNPTVEHNEKALGGFFLPLFEVTEVLLGEDETVLTFHAGYREEFAFNFTPEAYLIVDGVKYPAIGAEGIDHTIGIDTIRTESVDFKLRFPALPAGTERFDFINGTDFHLHGITDGSTRRSQIIPSNWRDDKTGNWILGLYDECAVFDARFWDYAGAKPDAMTKSFAITDGRQTLKVTLGKEKDGRRKIKIGDRTYSCSAITGRTLPPYPTKDTRPFRDTHYVTGDSVEFVGWLKDMPAWLAERSNKYEISTYIYGEQENHSAPLDSLGRFSMKFPLDNTGEIYADWGRSFVRNVLEPGQRYFLLYDYKLGQTLFMGTDSRVQNELMIYAPQWRRASFYDYEGKLISEFIDAADSITTVLTHELDSVCSRYPTLSDRFRNAHLVNERINSLGTQIGYAGIPDSTVPYIMEKCMPYAGPPYSMSRNLPRFVSDLMKTLNRDWRKTFDFSKYESEIKYTPEEQAILARVDSLEAVFSPTYESIPDEEAKEAYRKYQLQRNKDLLIQYIQILNGDSRNRVYFPKRFMHEIPHGVAVMDSLGFDPVIKDMWLFYETKYMIDDTRSSLAPEIVTYLTENISMPVFLEKILAEHDKYVRIEQQASAPVTDTSMLKGVTEGDMLLEKILEPHRGKFVLIDFWGTWCAPCREALAHSQSLYKRLKDYDMVYIYLANNSSESMWQNLIEEYNVKGDNVIHYNLPGEQQMKLEETLNIHSFPSYRLFDKDGKLVDVNVDPRMPGGIETILKNLSR